jgi:uncharacterized membrane protein
MQKLASWQLAAATGCPMRFAMKWLLGLLFVAAGVNHFANTAFYVSIMPPYVPLHLLDVYVSGIAEVVLGILLLTTRFERFAAWGLVALLFAVFPANLHMALNPELFPAFPPEVLWGRAVFQAPLVAWAYWFTRPTTAEAQG